MKSASEALHQILVEGLGQLVGEESFRQNRSRRFG